MDSNLSYEENIRSVKNKGFICYNRNATNKQLSKYSTCKKLYVMLRGRGMEKALLYLQKNYYYKLDKNIQDLVYRLFREFVYRDIYTLFRNHELAEDIVQDSFLKVVETAPKLKYNKNIRAWIIRVARNHAYDTIRKNKKYHYLQNLQEVVERKSLYLQTTVEELVEIRLRNRLLYEALNNLKPIYRKALYMHYIEEKKYKEIAKKLGKSEQALAKIMERARKQLIRYYSLLDH